MLSSAGLLFRALFSGKDTGRIAGGTEDTFDIADARSTQNT